MILGTTISISGWIPTIFQKELNISPEISNYSASFFWGSVIIGRISVGLLSRKIKDIKIGIGILMLIPFACFVKQLLIRKPYK